MNYHLWKHFGRKVFRENNRFLKLKYLLQTEEFYEKWGGFTFIAALFAPIVRTFAPFVAGIGRMNYKKFLSYNILGAITWVFTFTLAGYFFGNIPIIKRNFTLVIFAVILLSLIPMIAPWIKVKLRSYS